MRWVVTGSGGFLGTEMGVVLAGQDVVLLDRTALDITDASAVSDAIHELRPDVLVNAAGDKRADSIEQDESAAWRINADGPGFLADACKRAGAVMVHISADYVFDGDSGRPYREDDEARPRSAYGRTKLAGEQRVLESGCAAYVVRTAWLYGDRRPNFVTTMARLERERPTVSVVDDQRGTPTWVRHLARRVAELASRRPSPGVYHCASAGDTTWHGFARAVFERLGADPDRVLPMSTADMSLPAPRPAYSVLDTTKWRAAGLAPIPDWLKALDEAFEVIGPTLGTEAP